MAYKLYKQNVLNKELHTIQTMELEQKHIFKNTHYLAKPIQIGVSFNQNVYRTEIITETGTDTYVQYKPCKHMCSLLSNNEYTAYTRTQNTYGLSMQSLGPFFPAALRTLSSVPQG